MSTTTRNQAGNTAVHVVLAVLVVAAVGLAAWRVVDRHRARTAALVPTSSSVSTSTPQSTTLAPGTDNTSLNSDLGSINSSLNVSSQDTNSANSAINDQQNEIAIPTN